MSGCLLWLSLPYESLFVGVWFAAVYYAVYHLRRLPLLARALSEWPKSLDYLFISVPQQIDPIAIPYFDYQNSTWGWHLSPKVRRPSWRQPVNRFHDGSIQEVVLRVAMRDLFQDREGPVLNVGLFHWFFYWLTPVWAGYSVLLVLLLMSVFFQSYQYANSLCLLQSLFWLAMLWAMFTVVFLFRQLRFLSSSHWRARSGQLDRLPPSVSCCLHHYDSLPEKLSKITAEKYLALVYAATVTSYMFLINVVNLLFFKK